MLYFVGLGLGSVDDITVKGLRIVKSAKRVYLEAYTSILTVGKDDLEKFYGREIILADRTMVEQDADEILHGAKDNDVAFLVVGDPFGATTHTDLAMRATEKNIAYNVIHNASILNAIGCCGLQLYNFGETVSIVLWEEDWTPDSFYDKIMANKKRGLHTLCLLDIKMKEQTVENMMKGRKVYEPPRFLTCSAAIRQLLSVANKRENTCQDEDLNSDTVCIGLARVGWESQKIVAGTMSEVAGFDLGPPIHSLVIPGKMHFLEADMVKQFAITQIPISTHE
eukprot:gene8039-8901_t